MNETIEELLEIWEDEREEGRSVSVSELCENDAELAGRLQREIDSLLRMEWMDVHFAASTSHDVNPRHRAGEIIENRYCLLEVLGVGGSGVVWLARERNGNRVAIKLLHEEERFSGCAPASNEYYTSREICHPNIVPTIEFGGRHGAYFIVSKLIEGETLAEWIGGTPCDPNEAVRIIRDIASALAFLHKKGIIHRDLKPANILLDNERRVYLTDFGIALKTVPGTRVVPPNASGTIPYMAPEQLTANARIDIRCDIYALGLILYEMLTGRRPFPFGANSAAGGTPVSPSHLNPNVPLHIDSIIEWCLERSPDLRYSSAGELIDALEHPDWPLWQLRPRQDRPSAPQPFPEDRFASPPRLDRVPTSERITLPDLELDAEIEPPKNPTKILISHSHAVVRGAFHYWSANSAMILAVLGLIAAIVGAIYCGVMATTPQKKIPEEELCAFFTVTSFCLVCGIIRVRQWQPLFLSALILVFGTSICWFFWPHKMLGNLQGVHTLPTKK